MSKLTSSVSSRPNASPTRRCCRWSAHRSAATALVVLLLTAVSPSAGAQSDGAEVAPANDDFASAQVITGGTSSTSGTTTEATLEPGELNEGHARDQNHSVWYRWTAPSTAITRFTASGAQFDAGVTAWTGATLTSLQQVVQGSAPTVEFPALSGQAYYIRVSARTHPFRLDPATSGPFTLAWQPVALGNDHFTDSIWMGTHAGSTRWSNDGATKEPGEPAHAGVPSATTSVWFSWEAHGSGTVTMDTFGGIVDTVLAVYEGSAVNSLTHVASNDDAGGGTQSEVGFATTAGSVYEIVVAGFGGQAGVGPLNWRFEPAPANDDFANAETITGTAGTEAGSTLASSSEVGEPNHAWASSYFGGPQSVWYRWTAPAAGRVSLTTASSSYATTLGVYAGTSLSDLHEVASAEFDFSSGWSATAFVAEQGTTYHIAVAGRVGEAGNVVLGWGHDACPVHGLTDVPAWISEAATWATCLGFMSGYPNNTFGPNLPITRAQVASLLYKIAGSPDVSVVFWPGHGLSDVPAWVEDPVKWMVGWGYATGYPNGTFRPNNNITRAEMARMLFRIAGEPTGSPANAFPDVPNWVDAAVDWLTDPARTPAYASGYPDGTFRPNNNITRAQTTRMTCRIHREPGTC